jgi:hypothetical protein
LVRSAPLPARIMNGTTHMPPTKQRKKVIWNGSMPLRPSAFAVVSTMVKQSVAASAQR